MLKKGNRKLEGKTIENILLNDKSNTAVRNNGGGFTTNLFWTVMSPNGGGTPGICHCH
jgi:Fe-Mn family superoxide dismutase